MTRGSHLCLACGPRQWAVGFEVAVAGAGSGTAVVDLAVTAVLASRSVVCGAVDAGALAADDSRWTC